MVGGRTRLSNQPKSRSARLVGRPAVARSRVWFVRHSTGDGPDNPTDNLCVDMSVEKSSLRAGSRIVAMCAAALVAACAGGPTPDGAGKAARPDGASRPGTGPSTAPVADAPVAAPPPPAPLTPQEVQRSISAVLDHLQAGQEEPAEAELKKVLQSEPGNRIAQSLMRQIQEDPVTLLGRESFSYRVQPGESLSRIAGRFMGDVMLFYALAKYNNIKVPRTLSGGQVVKVPGKAPPPTAAVPAPAPAPAPSPAPAPASPTPPQQPAPTATAAAGATAGGAAANDAGSVAARAAKQKSEAVARHTRAARAAFAKQDLDGAIRSWDAVLEIEPDNRTAVLERQKVVGLKDKLSKVK